MQMKVIGVRVIANVVSVTLIGEILANLNNPKAFFSYLMENLIGKLGENASIFKLEPSLTHKSSRLKAHALHIMNTLFHVLCTWSCLSFIHQICLSLIGAVISQ